MNFGLIMLRAIAATGMLLVLKNHVPLAWWEAPVISFGVIIFFGNIGIR